MANNQLLSIVDYLRLGSTVHEEHLNTIRDMYKQLISQRSTTDIDEQDDPSEIILTEITRGLNIRNDAGETQAYLSECVRYEDINVAKLIIEGKLLGNVEPLEDAILEIQDGSCPTASSPPLLSSRSVDVTENETILAKINCVLNIKITIPEVQTFIHSFLLQKVNKPETFIAT
jgi:hypothetical protein